MAPTVLKPTLPGTYDMAPVCVNITPFGTALIILPSKGKYATVPPKELPG